MISIYVFVGDVLPHLWIQLVQTYPKKLGMSDNYQPKTYVYHKKLQNFKNYKQTMFIHSHMSIYVLCLPPKSCCPIAFNKNTHSAQLSVAHLQTDAGPGYQGGAHRTQTLLRAGKHGPRLEKPWENPRKSMDISGFSSSFCWVSVVVVK